MGTWEPPEGFKKVNMVMREDFHHKISIMAAKAKKRPWEILDRLLSVYLEGKKVPDLEDIPE